MHSITRLIALALEEDIGPGDVTTDNLIDPELEGEGVITAKEPAVLAGLHVAQQVFESLDPKARFVLRRQDGDRLHSGDPVLEVSGKMRALLKGERTALNFLQHLSGIATCVKSYVDLLQDRPVRLRHGLHQRQGQQPLSWESKDWWIKSFMAITGSIWGLSSLKNIIPSLLSSFKKGKGKNV